MKRKYYRYLLYSILAGITIISTVYFFYTLRDSVFHSNDVQSLNRQTADSIKVISLNSKAFSKRLSDPKNTVELADSALILAKAIGYLPGIAESYRTKGIGFAYLENTSLSTKNYLEALRIFSQLKDEKNIARTYSNIGSLYKSIDPDKALPFYNKALKIAGKINDEELVGGIYFNIALVYSRKSEYKVSLVNFDRSYQIFRKLKDTVSMAIYLQNTGRVYYQLHQPELAKARLTQAIAVAEDLNLYTALAGCYMSLCYIYLDGNQLNAAQAAISKGRTYSAKVNNRILDNDFVRLAYELELKRKNYPKALQFLSLAYHNDSLLLNENQSHNIDINSQRYLQQQKIQENELVITTQKYREARFRWIVTLGILILLLAAVTIFTLYFLREKRRRQKEIVIENNIAALEQKALQAMMNPHFVFNVMNSIQHFINQADAKTANQLLSGFARLARKHLEICMNSTITLQEELVYLRLYLSLEKVRFSERLNYEIRIGKDVDTDDILIPSMLIQPFIENAIWHGIMPKEDGGFIKLTFEVLENDLRISIIDDGIGISNSEKIKKTGHISRGMTLIKERVNLINRLNKRHIFIDQHQMGDFGTEVLIQIPA